MRAGDDCFAPAVCFRTRSQRRVEILLVATRETRRWTIPKGWAIKGLKPHEVAEHEAWGGSGCQRQGQKETPWLLHLPRETLADGNKAPALVEVHLAVEKVSDKFPEFKERTTEWMSPVEAATRVEEPELKGLLVALETRPAA